MKKLIAFICILSLSSACLLGQTSNVITAENRADWFKEAKFGIFTHWGLYSILAGSYNGHTMPDTTMPNGKSWYAEWIQQRLEVPANEYQSLEKQFNPVNFDADAWIAEVKNAGARYFVITAKHHDGFALWDSDVSDFDLGSSAYKGDLLGDLAKACKKYGIKYGFYYSHWQDWHHPQGAVPYWQPTRPDAEFEKYWREKSLPQVRELIERYDPDLFWFDTWDEETHINETRRDELIAMIRKLSPKCLINGRISFFNPGNEIDFLEMHDNNYPDKILEKPWQTPATMVHSWGWHAQDYNWKSAQRMLGYLLSNTAKGGNYLLNIGPRPDGTFPPAAVHRLREMGGWLYANGEAVYGAKPVKLDGIPDGVTLTQKEINGGWRNYVVRFDNGIEMNTLSNALRFFDKSVEVIQFGQKNQVKIKSRYLIDELDDSKVCEQLYKTLGVFFDKPLSFDEFNDAEKSKYGIISSEQVGDTEQIIYVSINCPLCTTLTLPINPSEVKKCSLLETDMPIKFSSVNGKLKLILPPEISSNCNFVVIKIEL